jgi:hypothetical protein
MSLSDLREEEARFMFQSLANRGKSNLIAALGVRNRYHDAMEQAKGIVTRLTLVLARVLDCAQWAVKN